MAIFRCKMCGGDLEIIENASSCTCDFCGTQQTIPTVKDENLQGLLKDAGITIGKVKFNRYEKIAFGHYIYAGNDKQPLTWYVLKKDGNNAFLITEKAIDCVKYHKEYKNITWEKCTLRKWLNNDFIKDAFTEKEAQRIIETKVINRDNEEYGTNGGSDTLDKVFCLSIDEANALFTTDKERIGVVTPYAKYKGAYCDSADEYDIDDYESDEEYEEAIESATEGGCWWLRSPGDSSRSAAYVRSDGSVPSDGDFVDYGYGAVRPVLWVDVSNL